MMANRMQEQKSTIQLNKDMKNYQGIDKILTEKCFITDGHLVLVLRRIHFLHLSQPLKVSILGSMAFMGLSAVLSDWVFLPHNIVCRDKFNKLQRLGAEGIENGKNTFDGISQ